MDPAFYAQYLESQEVLETSAFDPALRARVEVLKLDTTEFFDDKRIRHYIKDRRGVAVFVPTRAEVEKVAGELGARWPKLNAAFYHGGEPIRVIRPFLEGTVEKPFVLAMTAAGQSALNVPGLDTVVIYDARYGNVVDRGRNVLHRMYLGANEILQMAGRVHGRVPRGEVTILSDRQVDFASLKPGPPEFQLAGDAERVALTCAALGVDATELDLPVALDRTAYRRALELLTERGLIAEGRLTEYGRQVDAMPVERHWGELLVHADVELTPMVAVCASIESLHRMTREERDLHGVMSTGSDHLTIYNLYAEAVNQHGSLGSVYGLGRHVFDEGIDEWAERRGVLVKAIEDGALGVASVYRALEQPLPARFPYASKEIRRKWGDLLARFMPFDLVIDEETADGREARISKTSVAGNWGAVAGNLRYFADRFGTPRASIEGTTLSYDLIREHASWSAPDVWITGDGKRQGLAVARRLRYFGFELDADVEPISGDIPAELVEKAREALAAAVMRDATRHSDQGVVIRAVEMLDEWWRRSGARSRRRPRRRSGSGSGPSSTDVASWQEFLRTRLALDPTQIVAADQREQLERLPGMVRVAGDAVAIEYALERGKPVARLILREGQARRLRASEIPAVDRPLRLVVHRGEGPAVEAGTIEDLDQAARRLAQEDRQAAGPADGPATLRTAQAPMRRSREAKGESHLLALLFTLHCSAPCAPLNAHSHWSLLTAHCLLTHAPLRLSPLAFIASVACNSGDNSAAAPRWCRIRVHIARAIAGLRPQVEIEGRPQSRWTLAERMAHYKVPGISVAIISGGKVVWAGGFGVKEAGTNDSVTATTLFQAASISKPVTATAMLRLVSEGKVALDTNVNRYLKSWQVPDNKFTATEKVTLRRIASHSAGLTVHGFPGYAEGAPVPTVVQILNGAKPANTAAVRVDTTPGAIWRYAGGGTTIEQLIMTEVTGEPFPALMKRLVLDPAGMTHSTYEQPLPEARWAEAARGPPGRRHDDQGTLEHLSGNGGGRLVDHADGPGEMGAGDRSRACGCRHHAAASGDR